MRLVEKYDRPGPRYTSYPTVPTWTRAFGSDQLADRLEAAGRAGDDLPLSLYIHLPFCKSMCTYCGCNVVISSNRQRHKDYVELVRKELDQIADKLGNRNKLVQIHYGGGTPTMLDEGLLLRLWEKIAGRFQLLPAAELAIEVDPVVTRREQLGLLRGLGFNRLSMGVQDFTPEVQRAVNRMQSIEETQALADYARGLGYKGINFDLIYGLPHQRLETFAHTIDEVIRIGPDRLAIFSYAHVPELRAHQRKIDEATLPTGQGKLELFTMAQEKLLAAGYVSIGMDHFAKAEDELAVAQAERRLSRNFQGYTVNPAPDTIAAGATAIADVQGAFAQNVRPIPTYTKAIEEGRFPTERGILLTADDRLRRDAITELMCNFHLDLARLGRKHEVDASSYLEGTLEKLRPMEADGLVRLGDQRVEVTDLGRPFIRPVAMAFDTWLDRMPKPAKRALPLFSRTV